jgi:hypothetical protein
MNRNMKNRYRVFRRGWGTFYCEDLVTKKQTTLGTRDKDEAFRLVAAKNETEEAPAFSLHLARWQPVNRCRNNPFLGAGGYSWARHADCPMADHHSGERRTTKKWSRPVGPDRCLSAM